MIVEPSSITSPTLSVTLPNVTLSQFRRTYSSGVNINFLTCFDDIVDIESKQYSNFYLTKQLKLDSVFDEIPVEELSSSVLTTLRYGEFGDYLQFSLVYTEIPKYGTLNFTPTPLENTSFTIEFFDENRCRIHAIVNYKKFYLSVNSENKLIFVLEKLIPTSGVINPHDFEYIYSKAIKGFVLFKKNEYGDWLIKKEGNKLVLVANTQTTIPTPWYLSRDIYTPKVLSTNTSFITYNIDNTINVTKSVFDLENNILFHRPIRSSHISPIILKNHLLPTETFSCANNMMIDDVDVEHCKNLRDYTSIFRDVKTENSEELELNYVFYNQTFDIFPGKNEINTPETLFPYDALNINDTTLRQSGSFSGLVPKYSDRVYYMNPSPSEEGQHLLCTWLSGHPFSDEKVWVDRYYYPDLVDKEEAMGSYPPAAVTYNQYIENILQNDQYFYNTVDSEKFFDKKSDLLFIPNETYIYERISEASFPPLTSSPAYCNNLINYFLDLNKANEFTLGFYFDGDDGSWTVESEQNDIPCGINITKTENAITFTYSIYDNGNNTVQTWSASTTFKKLFKNFVFCSFSCITGDSYFYLNDTVVKKFTIEPYQFVVKPMLYGDIYTFDSNNRYPLFETNPYIENPVILAEYVPDYLAITKKITDGLVKIDNIHITLPCGMRNSSDRMMYLQNIGGVDALKSNKFNISVKNLNINDDTVINDLETYLDTNIPQYIPLVNDINDITFENYR